MEASAPVSGGGVKRRRVHGKQNDALAEAPDWAAGFVPPPPPPVPGHVQEAMLGAAYIFYEAEGAPRRGLRVSLRTALKRYLAGEGSGCGNLDRLFESLADFYIEEEIQMTTPPVEGVQPSGANQLPILVSTDSEEDEVAADGGEPTSENQG